MGGAENAVVECIKASRRMLRSAGRGLGENRIPYGPVPRPKFEVTGDNIRIL